LRREKASEKIGFEAFISITEKEMVSEKVRGIRKAGCGGK